MVWYREFLGKGFFVLMLKAASSSFILIEWKTSLYEIRKFHDLSLNFLCPIDAVFTVLPLSLFLSSCRSLILSIYFIIFQWLGFLILRKTERTAEFVEGKGESERKKLCVCSFGGRSMARGLAEAGSPLSFSDSFTVSSSPLSFPVSFSVSSYSLSQFHRLSLFLFTGTL